MLEKRREISNEIQLYEKYCLATHRTGIPLFLLREVLSSLNFDMNEILSQVIDFGVFFKINDGNDIELVMRSNIDEFDDTRSIAMASGMEKLIINLVVRSILLKNSKISRSNIYWIDEGFGVLDNNYILTMKELFDCMKKFFKKIVIITHIDQLKDIVDYSIVITKDQKNGSIVNV